VGREGKGVRWGGEEKGGEKGRGRSSPNVRDALTPLGNITFHGLAYPKLINFVCDH